MVKCPKQYAVKRLSNLEVFFMKIFKVILESGIADLLSLTAVNTKYKLL